MIKFSSVCYSYAGSTMPAVKDITLELPCGGVIGLVGTNGSGKSTLLRLLAGITRPQSGSIEIFGMQPHSRRAKKKTLILTGNENLPDFLTGRELLDLYSSLYRQPVDPDELQRLVNRYGLTGRIDSLLEDYSHGMRKKLQFIVALLMKRDLTIFDETLNGVDFQSIVFAKEDIATLAKSATVIVCTHDNFLIEGLATTYIGLSMGQLRSTITDEELIEKHGSLTSFLAELLQETAS